ncbi:MAG: murein biosynthesis integral membrane protein MurJ [Chloroflexi bacterium]|nr:murein biosynthesis integral membrane protein MurJ [Chloroflexota bacterium]
MTASRRQITTAALVIMIGNIASRLLGLVRDSVLAMLFGAQSGTDAFFAASRLPTIVYDLLIGGAISAALVPVLVDVREDRAHSWRLLSSLLSCFGLLSIVVCALLALVAPAVIGVLSGGFSAETQAQATDMARPMLGAVVLQGLAGVLMANLYARGRVALPAFAPAVYNGGIILAAIALHLVLGVNSLVVGVLLGAAGQLLLQLAGQGGLHYRPILDPWDPEVRAVLRLYAPVAAGMVVTIVGIVIDTNLASGLAAGSLTIMQIATRLIQFPLGLVATATSFAVLSSLAAHATGALRGDAAAADAYRDVLVFGLKLVLLLMLPATAGLIVLREPLVQLLFERGAFSAQDTERTALVFLAYAPQLPLTAIDQLLIFAFYARKNTVTPVLIGVVGVGLYLATALPAVGPFGMGAPGLALANAVQNGGHGLILLVLMWRSLGGFGGGLGSFLARAVLASLGMAALLQALHLLVAAVLPAHGATLLGLLIVEAALGGAAYLLLAHALGISELRDLAHTVGKRVTRA